MLTNKLRIIFLGTPDFAVASLKAIVENRGNVVAVVTAPDRPAGRGRQIQESAVKQYAAAQNIPVLQPVNLKDGIFTEELKSYCADLQIVVAFRMLPETVWNMPKHGTINLHASLLPKYRGAAPINWAIINGEKETGVSTFKLQHKIDTGDILLQETINITENDNVGSLHDKLMEAGANLLVKTIENIGSITGTPQQVTVTSKEAPKIFKPDCKVNWNETTIKTYNLIRGLSPYPCAWTELISPEGKTYSMKIYKAIHSNTKNIKPGNLVIIDNKLLVGTKDGTLQLEDIHLAGKKRMNANDFLRGFQLTDKWVFQA